MREFDLVVLGLSLSSSWGNGHATTYRALLKAYAARGHKILFLEREQPWYAAHRDLSDPEFCTLAFYHSVAELDRYQDQVERAQAVIVGSFVPDGIGAGEFVQKHAKGVTAFYDIDTPVTLAQLAAGRCAYLVSELIPGFDLYLSFTGGPTLDLLTERFGSPAARPLYCSVDETIYRPIDTPLCFDLGYLGTYSPDREATLERLLIEPARRAPNLSFIVGGPLYPDMTAWPRNVTHKIHIEPAEHPAFYNACRFTLNVTRRDMVCAGYSPSVRLFEAAACGTPIVSDVWPGLESFFEPQSEIALVTSTEEVLALFEHTTEAHRNEMSALARARVLQAHTATHRAAELEAYLDWASLTKRQTRTKRDPQMVFETGFIS